MTSKWMCPSCKAPANQCGRGDCDRCSTSGCMGLTCECPEDQEEQHGMVAADPCHNAVCDHCGWGGTLPYGKVEDPLKLLRAVVKARIKLPTKLLERIEKRLKQG